MPKPLPSYELTITLLDVSPPIWRRVVVPGGWHLGKVHDVIQVAMGWQSAHLHQFERDDQRWGEPSEWDGGGMRREQVTRLAEVMPNVGDELLYNYDFGDGWTHVFRVEQILPPQLGATCTAGARACPPEDSGGPWGYQELLDALADSAHPEHAERLEWLGDAHDAEAFDLSATDAAVRRLR